MQGASREGEVWSNSEKGRQRILPRNTLGFCSVLMFSYCEIFIHVSGLYLLVYNEKINKCVYDECFLGYESSHELELSPQSNIVLYGIPFST